MVSREVTVYVHYGCTAEEFSADCFRKIKNNPPFAKPTGGFWGSPTQAAFGWIDFCRREEYVPPSGLHKKFCFFLQPEAQIIQIRSGEDFDLLPKLEKTVDFPFEEIHLIDFEECCRCGIDAIEYCYSAIPRNDTLGDEMNQKMRGWDCDSILVMNPQIIQPLYES